MLMGCSTHVHTVGMGPQIGEVESARQWYVLYGAVPLNTVDTGAMANGADDYEIKTATMPFDVLIGMPALATISVSSALSDASIKTRIWALILERFGCFVVKNIVF